MSEPEFAVALAYPRQRDEHGHVVAEVVEYDAELVGADPRRITARFAGSGEFLEGVVDRGVPMAIAYMALAQLDVVEVGFAGWVHPL